MVLKYLRFSVVVTRVWFGYSLLDPHVQNPSVPLLSSKNPCKNIALLTSFKTNPPGLPFNHIVTLKLFPIYMCINTFELPLRTLIWTVLTSPASGFSNLHLHVCFHGLFLKDTWFPAKEAPWPVAWASFSAWNVHPHTPLCSALSG